MSATVPDDTATAQTTTIADPTTTTQGGSDVDTSSNSSADSSTSTSTQSATTVITTTDSPSSTPTDTDTDSSTASDNISTSSSSDSSSSSSDTSTDSSTSDSSTSDSRTETSSSDSSTTSTSKTTESSALTSSADEQTRKPTSTIPTTASSSTSSSFKAPSSVSSSGDDGDKKLSTGTIIGISLAGFIVAGILIAMLGSLLKWRRRKALEKKTAHLKRASDIWDFADSAGGDGKERIAGKDIDEANEQAASEAGSTVAPFSQAKAGHLRQESSSSFQSAGAGSVRSGTGSAASRRDVVPHRPAPPVMPHQIGFPPRPMVPAQQFSKGGKGGWANRISQAFMPARSAPMPPPLPMHTPPVGLPGQASLNNGGDYFSQARSGPMPGSLDRGDSFGARVNTPPRNAFFPPSPPQNSLAVTPPVHSGGHPLGVSPQYETTLPLALPGSRR